MLETFLFNGMEISRLEETMVKTIDYYMDEKFVKKDYLIIKNSLDSRRLCKVTLDEKLLKLVLLLPNEMREIKMDSNLKPRIRVVDITDGSE